LRLFVDGKAVHPRHEGDAAVFLFPTSAQEVRLLSNTFIPANLGGKDTRRLGVCLLGLTFAGAGGALRRISLDDARLAERLHDGELKSGAHWAWTKGDLPLDPQFWADLKGLVSLFVKHNSAATRQWERPFAAGGAFRQEQAQTVLDPVTPTGSESRRSGTATRPLPSVGSTSYPAMVSAAVSFPFATDCSMTVRLGPMSQA
jgi:hypothetical protein